MISNAKNFISLEEAIHRKFGLYEFIYNENGIIKNLMILLSLLLNKIIEKNIKELNLILWLLKEKKYFKLKQKIVTILKNKNNLDIIQLKANKNEKNYLKNNLSIYKEINCLS